MATVVDACTLINLHSGGVIEIAIQAGIIDASLEGIVLGECGSITAELEQLIADGHLNKLDEDLVDIEEFERLVRVYDLGDGETECLALAVRNGYSLASDDGNARKAAIAELGVDRVSGSLGILKRLVALGHLSPLQAFGIYQLMVEEGARLPLIDQDWFA